MQIEEWRAFDLEIQRRLQNRPKPIVVQQEKKYVHCVNHDQGPQMQPANNLLSLQEGPIRPVLSSQWDRSNYFGQTYKPM